jgi:methionyl-tRNA synthetase
MPERYYLTTPIYYVNDVPHIGTCYCTLASDTVARFHRLRGERVLFATGTDENAPKNAQAAAAAGESTETFVARMAQRFRDTWDELEISYDDFIRTTEPRHFRAVQQFFKTLQERGDIYQGRYEGWYCLPCETYFADDEVIVAPTSEPPAPAAEPQRLCPQCQRPVERVSEVNYFFALSRYGDRLLAHIREHPDFLQPEFRRNEVVQFIEAGLRDVSITRARGSADWGVPVPDDPSQIIYVWFDALINYATVAGYPDDAERLREWWPADLHLVGKDIYVRFHCTLWPAMLMAAGLEPPRQVFGHGFWTNEGIKISKSLGNMIDFGREVAALQELSGCRRDIATDALRYFLFRQIPFGQDADYSRAAVAQRYNGDLANDLGNALNRSIHMTGGLVPPPGESPELHAPLASLAAETTRGVEAAMKALDLQGALLAIWRYISAINKYLDDHAPWKLAKAAQADPGKQAELAAVLYAALEGCRLTSVWLAPFMPTVAAEMRRQLGVAEPTDWSAATTWGGLQPSTPLGPVQPIFPRIDRKTLAELERGGTASDAARDRGAKGSPQATTEKRPPGPEPAASSPQSSTITYDDFARLELRVVEILAAERVPKADKLLHLRVSLGDQERTVLAGLAEYYAPEALVGRKAILVANLAPRKIRGLESQGMLLAGEAEGRVSLLQPDQDLPPGATVR